MEKTHQVIIRTRQSDYNKIKVGKIDFGHVGVTLINDAQQETHFDYATAIAEKRYHALSTKFERAASYVSLAAFTTAGILAGFIAASLHTESTAVKIAAEFAGAIGGTMIAPLKCVKLKRQGSVHTHEAGSYPPTDYHFSIDITKIQYDDLKERFENHNPSYHMIGFYNCVHKVKEILQSAGIHTAKTLYDSPNRFRAELMQPPPQ